LNRKNQALFNSLLASVLIRIYPPNAFAGFNAAQFDFHRAAFLNDTSCPGREIQQCTNGAPGFASRQNIAVAAGGATRPTTYGKAQKVAIGRS